MSEVQQYRIAIRALVEFTERRGDINFRFSSRSSAQQGIRGHQRLQKSRGEGYVAEKEVCAEVHRGGLTLSLGGRADGYYPDRQPLEVEEIKTVRVPAAKIPADIVELHWAQAMIYGWLLAEEHKSDQVLIRLCYLNLDDDSEETLVRQFGACELERYFLEATGRYLDWLQALETWRRRRDASIASLAFPYADYRAGQRDMAVSVYRALREERHLVLQAPTGIGKTMGALFPAIKSLRELDYEKIFFLTAKTSGQASAEQSVQHLKASGLELRDITLTAKDKICLNPGSPCDPEHCEYAAGYYDRLPAVLNAAMHEPISFTRETIIDIAEANSLCPFELSLDLSRLSDVVICDYNYVFDPTVYLRRYFDDESRRYALLVDESHNLVERGRDMFSAVISKRAYLDLRRQLRDTAPGLGKALARINREILALRNTDKESFERDRHLRLGELPEKVMRALRAFCEVAEDWLDEGRPMPFQPDLLELYFQSLRFCRTSDWVDENYAVLLEAAGKDTLLRLYNLNPANGLAAGLGRGTAGLCFSATMTPRPYFERLLGVGEDSPWYRIASPFDPANLGVYSASFISTAFRDRDATLNELARLVAGVIAARRGNYLVFLPSHVYLDKLHRQFTASYPDVRTIRQQVSMNEVERADFLGAFSQDDGQETLLGFAVMGGVFGEAVDLQGTRLIGVIVVGVGLPGLSVDRDLIRDYFGDDGFEFAYQYPGINRVLQTAGRVIRSETDKGIVCLVDRRFREARYRRLLPPEWQVIDCEDENALSTRVSQFWQARDGQAPPGNNIR